MFQEMMIGSSGGSNNGAYGTTTDVQGANQTVTINTGLTSIKRFFIYYLCNAAATIKCWETYNYDLSSTKYQAVNQTSSAATFVEKDIGTASGNTYISQIASISGGTVTMQTTTNANSAIKSAWWMAVE